MIMVSGLLANSSGVVHSRQFPKQPYETWRCNKRRFVDRNVIQLVEKIPRRGFHYSLGKHSGDSYVTSVGKDYSQLSYDEHVPEEPFWPSLIKEAIWALKSLFKFLIEQPSQLKYIEWPGFQSTLKTATLTLGLVALLIVALSSLDSALSFMLALFLRRPA